ncbi:MAG: hypothetical protein WBM64_12370 [Woeseiaceae bacterium]
MTKLTIAAMFFTSISTLVACDSEPVSQQRVWEDETGIVELVDISDAAQRALKAAPAMALVGTLSGELKEAIDSNSIERIKVQLVRDKMDGEIVDEFPPTYQGWIYYEPTKRSDGSPYAPAVLCVSQSVPIEWNHCQDASDSATRRLLEKLRP